MNIKIPKPPKIMGKTFKNDTGEILSLSEIIKNKTITEIKFSYLYKDKKTFIKRIFTISKEKEYSPISEKIFHLKCNGIKIYPGDTEIIIAFSSQEEYERFKFNNYYTEVYKSKKEMWINCNNKFQFHFPPKRLKKISWK